MKTKRAPVVRPAAESPLLQPLRSFKPKPPGWLPPAYQRWPDRVFIHCCKDGTCSLRRPNQPIFNGVALAVYVVPNMDAAIALQVLMCFRTHYQHPDMKKGDDWYKFNDVRQSPHRGSSMPPWEGEPLPVFDVDDLPYLQAKIHACYERHIARRRK